MKNRSIFTFVFSFCLLLVATLTTQAQTTILPKQKKQERAEVPNHDVPQTRTEWPRKKDKGNDETADREQGNTTIGDILRDRRRTEDRDRRDDRRRRDRDDRYENDNCQGKGKGKHKAKKAYKGKGHAYGRFKGEGRPAPARKDAQSNRRDDQYEDRYDRYKPKSKMKKKGNGNNR